MIKKENSQCNVVLRPDDRMRLDYVCDVLGLKPTQVFRLALLEYYRKVKAEKLEG